jgi:toxin ParE1/3/4
LSEIVDSVDILPDFPKAGQVVSEYNIDSVREIIYQYYRIIYKIENAVIYILSVIHGSRKLKKHLKKKDLDNI